MIDLWYQFVDLTCPWNWSNYVFMKNALLAVLLVCPVVAFLGTMVVNNKMAFFSDVLGHSTLAGVAIGIGMGFVDPLVPMILFTVVLSLAFNFLKKLTKASADTVLGVFFAFVVALGIVLLSRGGSFVKYTNLLIGDILAVNTGQLLWLMVLFIIVSYSWFLFSNALMLISVSPMLAKSRGIKTFWIETGFTILLAIVVASSIKLVGILIINSLLILPAAASRNMARNMKGYTIGAVVISLVSGVSGLITSYYWGTASGATIVLFAVAFYVLTAILGQCGKKI